MWLFGYSDCLRYLHNFVFLWRDVSWCLGGVDGVRTCGSNVGACAAACRDTRDTTLAEVGSAMAVRLLWWCDRAKLVRCCSRSLAPNSAVLFSGRRSSSACLATHDRPPGRQAATKNALLDQPHSHFAFTAPCLLACLAKLAVCIAHSLISSVDSWHACSPARATCLLQEFQSLEAKVFLFIRLIFTLIIVGAQCASGHEAMIIIIIVLLLVS